MTTYNRDIINQSRMVYVYGSWLRVWESSEDDRKHLIIPRDMRFRSGITDYPFVTETPGPHERVTESGHRYISITENKKIRENLAELD